jgi:thiol-disulfide isomerase/thioredoxin
MAYVAAAFLGAVCLVNLVLVLALARRVRGHDEQLTRQSRLPPIPRLPVGSQTPDFTVTAVTGETRSRSDLMAGPRGVIAFLTPQCAPCRAHIPELTKYAAADPGGPSQVIAVICGTEDEAATMVGELKDSVSVVVEPLGGPTQKAFAVTEYPTFCVITKQGRIGARGAHLEAWNGYHLRVAVR